MATKRQNSVPDLATLKANEALNKARIKELEEEVSNLKKKLEDLRKAKNTTITKREREIVEVGVPFGKRESKDEIKVGNMEKKIDGLDKKHEKEMEDLRKKFAAEMEAFKKSNQKTCAHQGELRKLKFRIEDLEDENKSTRIRNDELKEQVEEFMTELLLKEAQWCAKEEELSQELSMSFNEKYKEWMCSTEAKIQELQQTNEMLRGYLKNKK